MAGTLSDKLLGVRSGFLRYFHDGLERPVAVSVVPQRLPEESEAPLPLSEEDILGLARRNAQALREDLGTQYAFYVGTEAGLFTFEAADQLHHFVHSWTVILGLGDEAWGSSGAVQLPERLIRGLDQEQIPFAVPGTLRSGGMVSSLTGGLENRRSATSLSTFHALSTLLYGIIESRPLRRRRGY